MSDNIHAAESPLSQNFTMKSLLKFALPTILMMIFMGLYTVVDTVFRITLCKYKCTVRTEHCLPCCQSDCGAWNYACDRRELRLLPAKWGQENI